MAAWVERNRLRSGKSSTRSFQTRLQVNSARSPPLSTDLQRPTTTDIDEKSYRIAIKPSFPSGNGDEDAESPTILLTITYPSAYPDEAPILDLSLPPNAPKPPHFDLSSDRPYLLSSLSTAISENLGIAMIFTLVTTLQENIEALIRERVAAVQKAKDREAEEAEAKENAKFHGEKVTKESFLRWREKFREEMRLKEEDERARREAESKVKGVKKEEKLTGRELWERGMVGKEVEEEEGGLEEGVESLKMA
ncbi:MAG: hypothetical protein Q9219_004421 [cf. Caloplaca sp. 3 TL-2023]